MNDFLETRFEKIRDDSEGDWPDVLRRVSKRGRRRRLTVLGAAVLGVVVLVPAALALRTTFIDFFQSEPAPQRLVLDFARQDVGAPPGLENHVIYEQTRKIFERRIDNGQVLTLWVAPNRRGGFCMALVGPRHPGGFGCLWGPSPLSPTIEVAGPITRSGVIEGGPFLVWGSVGVDRAETIELHYEDGAVESQPLTWVSKPIDAAFFLFDVPEAHWLQGHRFDRLVVRDGKGAELRSKPVSFRVPLLPR